MAVNSTKLISSLFWSLRACMLNNHSVVESFPFIEDVKVLLVASLKAWFLLGGSVKSIGKAKVIPTHL
jgi:hypothetical protein